MTDITARIAESRRLEKAATPGPWDGHWNDEVNHDAGVDVDDRDGIRVALCEFDGDYDGKCRHDAYLIARMRNEYAALLDVVEAAQNLASAAVPQWAPELRAALAVYARSGGAQ